MAPTNKSILQRMDEVEVQIQGLRGISAAVQNIQSAQRQTLAILAAFIQEMGGAELDKKIHERLLDQQRQFVEGKIAEQKKVLTDLQASGQLVAGAEVTRDSILVLQEAQVVKTKQGEEEVEQRNVTQPYLQMHIAQLLNEDEKIGTDLLGKSLGYEYRNADYSLKVVEIYEPAKVTPLTEPAASAETPASDDGVKQPDASTPDPEVVAPATETKEPA